MLPNLDIIPTSVQIPWQSSYNIFNKTASAYRAARGANEQRSAIHGHEKISMYTTYKYTASCKLYIKLSPSD